MSFGKCTSLESIMGMALRCLLPGNWEPFNNDIKNYHHVEDAPGYKGGQDVGGPLARQKP